MAPYGLNLGTAAVFDNGGFFVTGYDANFNNPSFINLDNRGWKPLVVNPDGQTYGAAAGFGMVLARAYGQSAMLEMRDAANPYGTLERTDDGGATWNRVYAWNGQNVPFDFCFDLLSDDEIWTWDPFSNYDPETAARSMDGELSSSQEGILKTTSNAWDQTVYHYSADIHTAREVMWSGNWYGYPDDAAYSFSFDEEPATGSAMLMPLLTFKTGGYNSHSGLLDLNLANISGDWAQIITITGLSVSNDGTFSSSKPLPWKVGSVPPYSTIGDAYYSWSSDLSGELNFALDNLPSSGTRFRVTLTGRYNIRQQFSITRYFIAP